MSEEARYVAYLVEQYAARRGTTGGRVFALLEKAGLLAAVRDRYYTYHTERVENAIADLDALLAEEAPGGELF